MKFKNSSLLVLITLFGAFFSGCDKEPVESYLSQSQIEGSYRITYEAVYNRANTYYDLDASGNQVSRDPVYVSYDSQRYNYMPSADGASRIPINAAKFYIQLKPAGTVEMYDIDNEATLKPEDPKYTVPRKGTWEFTGKNTFIIKIDKYDTSFDPNNNRQLPAVVYYCVITNNGLYNSKKYLIVKARANETTAYVKEMHLLSDPNIKSALNN